MKPENKMKNIEKLIYSIHREINIQSIYLSKSHKKGNFDFQIMEYKDLEPYLVDKRKIGRILEHEYAVRELTHSNVEGFSFTLEGEKWKVFEMNNANEFFITGVFLSLGFVSEKGEVFVVDYSKNINPTIFAGNIIFPEGKGLNVPFDFDKSVYGIFKKRGERYSSSLTVNLNTSFHSRLKEEAKKINPLNFKRSSGTYTVDLKSEYEFNLEEFIFSIEYLLGKLDDKCPDVFNRMDTVFYLMENKEKIIYDLKNLNYQNKEKLIKKLKDKEDWLELIPLAIDLTQNKFYQGVYEKFYKSVSWPEISQEINNIVLYVNLNMKLDTKDSVMKKKKI